LSANIRKSSIGYGYMEVLLFAIGLLGVYFTQIILYVMYAGYVLTLNMILGYAGSLALIVFPCNVTIGSFLMAVNRKKRLALEDGIITVAEKRKLRNERVKMIILTSIVIAGSMAGSYALEAFYTLPNHIYILGVVPIWIFTVIINICYILVTIILQYRVTRRFDRRLASIPNLSYRRRTQAQENLARKVGSRKLSTRRGLAAR
jgi:hypothetical protein